MFPGSHSNYVFVTKIPRLLILYFTFLKNNDNSSFNETVGIESALYIFLFALNVSYCFWQIVLLTYQEQAAAHICTLYSTHIPLPRQTSDLGRYPLVRHLRNPSLMITGYVIG